MIDEQEHQDHEDTFYRFLLGEMPPQEQERLEIRLLEEAELQELVQAAEFDLIDDYIRGDLTAEQTRSFEQSFMNSAARRSRLETARVLINWGAQAAASAAAGERLNRASVAPTPRAKTMITWHSVIRLAASLILLVGGGVAIWRFLMPWWQVRSGLAMLNEAYSQGRPIEARLSGFQYASRETDRGAGQRPVDYPLRDQANLTLLSAARAHPDARTIQALGSSYLLKREIQEAIEQFNRALVYDPSNARIHNDLGAALMESAIAKRRQLDRLKSSDARAAEQLSGEILSDLSLANEHFSKALQLEERLADALFNQALCLEQLGLIDQALERWERYLQIDGRSGWAAEARERLEALKKRKDQTLFDPNRVFQNFLAAYQAGDQEGIWRSFMLGSRRKGNLIVEQLLDQYLEGRDQGRQAEVQDRLDMLAMAGEIESQRGGDLYTRDLAAFYRTIGPRQVGLLINARRIFKTAREQSQQSRPEARSLYQQARQIFNRAGSVGETASADLMIMSFLARDSEYEAAKRLAEALIRDSKERSHLSILARSLYLTAYLSTGQNRLARAAEYSRQALSVAERSRDWNEQIGILGQLASVYWLLGAYEESMTYAHRALESAAGYPVEPEILWVIYRVSADALTGFSRLFTSASFDQQALRLALEMKIPLLISRSYGFLSEAYGRLKNYREAIALARKDLEIGTEHGGGPIGLDIQAHALLRLGRFYREIGSLNESLQAFNNCIRISESRKLLSESLDVRRGRLMLFLAQRDYHSARAELETALELFEKNRNSIQGDELKIDFFEAGQDIYELGIELSTVLQNDYQEAFRYSERGRARSLLDLMASSRGRSERGSTRLSNQPLTLSSIIDQVPDSAQIVQYSSLSQALHVWVVSKSGSFGTIHHAGSEELSREVTEYLECIGDARRADRAELLAKELYRQLIKPIEARLEPDKEIFIVADKPFNNFPFGALIDPETGKYLIEKYVISFAPSSTVFIECSNLARRKESFSGERCLTIGQSVFRQPELLNSALPSTIKEAEQVAAHYGPHSKLLLDSQATEGAVRHEMVNAEVIHIATHGLVNERRPEYSGLALWEKTREFPPENDGLLQAGEVSRMKLPRARLVVLSACQTLIGRDYQGEGMVGLARAFIASGAPVVIASLWKIDSQITAMIMDTFHRYRTRSNLSTARAIREAQLEMLRHDSPIYRRPYSWAGLMVVGGYTRF